jgi:hypothetical protein
MSDVPPMTQAAMETQSLFLTVSFVHPCLSATVQCIQRSYDIVWLLLLPLVRFCANTDCQILGKSVQSEVIAAKSAMFVVIVQPFFQFFVLML